MLHARHETFRNTIVPLLVLFLLPSPVALQAAESLTPEAARAHVGETRTVCGPVANTYYSRFVDGKPTFINFGRPYPRHVFSIAIMGADRAKFDNAPEKVFEGKKVCVTGLIESHDNKPLIVVKEKARIRLVD